MYQFYFARFLVRAALFIFTTFELIVSPENLDFTANFGMGHGINVVNALWLILMVAFILEFFPRTHIHIGGERQFKRNYAPTGKTVEQIKKQINDANIGAFLVLLVWVLGNLVIGILYKKGILITKATLLCITMFYYLSDLICVLFYCPFQYFLMKNRCCTTCRVFKWDSLMTVTPLIFAEGRFASSLVFVAAVLGLLWELRFKLYPERFFDATNENLKCKNCTTHMCRTKYQKFHPAKGRQFPAKQQYRNVSKHN